MMMRQQRGANATKVKGMLNQRPNSDAKPVLPTKRTYVYTIYATRTHHYVLIINISRARTHKSF